MTELEVERLTKEYCGNNMGKLKKICNPIISKIGGITDADYADLYSLAQLVFLSCLKRYDENNDKDCSFSTFLQLNLRTRLYNTYIRDKNRKKRANVQKDEYGNNVFLHDFPIDSLENDDKTHAMFDSGFRVEDEIMKNDLSENTQEFLAKLNDTQKEIAEMIMQDFSPNEIKAKLNLTDKEYAKQISDMRSYEKRKTLYKEEIKTEEGKMTISTNDAAEKYKNTSYSIASISRQLVRNAIRANHILQRHSGQWARFAKSELVCDVLRGKSLTQIIISEEFKEGLRMQWLIDGKQRCTTLDDYLHDGFSISKNVKNSIITYQTPKLDENGKQVYNDEGFPEVELREFDIRGKKFSKLPAELQEIFSERQIPILYNMNCTKQDIADDIARFNRSRPMNKAQSGWLGLEEGFAELVENIAKMPFFQTDFKGSSYTQKNFSSSEIRRIIVESIMVSDFLEDYNREFNKMCEFLTEEGSDSNFTYFYSLVERLSHICDERVANLFNAKDSFLWFGLFSRFDVLNLHDDTKFMDFLSAFAKSDIMYNKSIDGVTYKDLCINKETGKPKATKDKVVVTAKLDHLEKLMKDYLGIESVATREETIEEFVADCIESNVSEVAEDIEDYESTLDDLLDETVKLDSALRDEGNRPSLLAMMAYSYKEDVDLDEWMSQYARKNSTYIPQQKENYLHMLDDFNNYNMRRECFA